MENQLRALPWYTHSLVVVALDKEWVNAHSSQTHLPCGSTVSGTLSKSTFIFNQSVLVTRSSLLLFPAMVMLWLGLIRSHVVDFKLKPSTFSEKAWIYWD